MSTALPLPNSRRVHGMLLVNLIILIVGGCVQAYLTRPVPRDINSAVPELRPEQVGLPAMHEITDVSRFDILRQPQNISPKLYIDSWPALKQVFALQQDESSTKQIEQTLNKLIDTADRYGVLNLQAQRSRQSVDRDTAERLIQECIDAEPDQHLHHFQSALLSFDKLTDTRNPIAKWGYSNAVLSAYERAFALEPKIRAYRYYLVFAYQQTPQGFGGNPKRALNLATEAINFDPAFFLVRTHLYLLRDEIDDAFDDMDRAIASGFYKTTTLHDAIRAALQREDYGRAKRWAAYTIGVHSRWPDNWVLTARVLYASGQHSNALRCIEHALKLDPQHIDAQQLKSSWKNNAND